MISLIEDNREGIEQLCRQFHVARLEVFGSAANGEFDPEKSDVDFLVEFEPNYSLGPWLSRYFELKSQFEAMLGRQVDLVMSGAIKNALFAGAVNQTRRLLYAQKNA
ncbi:MAG: nucleotidyltransferase domain-containing protein [Planctomycetota bacterium]